MVLSKRLGFFSWAPKVRRKCESKHWFPCGADERSFGRSVYGQQNFGGITFLGSLANKLKIVTEPSHLVYNPS